MLERNYDVAVVGAGAAGLAATVEIRRQGFSCVVLEREHHLGGILMQCIHNGFGLQEFKRELTGPEFAEEFIEQLSDSDADVYLDTTVAAIEESERGKELYCYSLNGGIMKLNVRAVVLAMGCRERNRGNIGTPGSRPAGVFTAGLAQRLVNVEGYIPGKDVVIVGSGDIGLIMARRMTWVGSRVHAVVEIQPYPSGLTRNIVQCLNDFSIPLYLSHIVSRIEGKNRLENVVVTPLTNGIPDHDNSFEIACDTLLLSVGLVPENELSQEAGVRLNPQTGGPVVDSTMMTSVDGLFACGNVLHVHDLADYVAEEARRTGSYTAEWLRGHTPALQIPVKAGANVRYVNPPMLNPEQPDRLYLRSLIVKNNAMLVLKLDNSIVKQKKLSHVQPSEMVSIRLPRRDSADWPVNTDSALEVSIQ